MKEERDSAAARPAERRLEHADSSSRNDSDAARSSASSPGISPKRASNVSSSGEGNGGAGCLEAPEMAIAAIAAVARRLAP
jgi:hypothetical protein